MVLKQAYGGCGTETPAEWSVKLRFDRLYRPRLSTDFDRSETGEKPDHPLYNQKVLT